VCLHELVTGKLPYDGEDDVEVIRKLMTDEPPPLVEGLPEGVLRVLERSLVLDVDQRFPTAAAMQRALEAAMNEMDEATTSEDVAAFLRSELPELAQRRKGIVQKAVDEARDRAANSGETLVVEGDVAFAPTVMSERQTPPSTRREGRPTASSAPDQEPIRIPKTSRAWLWITLLVLAGGGAAAARWPALARGWLARIGIGEGPVVPATSETAAVPSAPAAEALPSASAAAALPPRVATAPSSAPPPHPEVSATHHTWPVGRDLPPPAGAAVSAPPSAAQAPTSPWSPYKRAPSPAESEGAPEGPAPP